MDKIHQPQYSVDLPNAEDISQKVKDVENAYKELSIKLEKSQLPPSQVNPPSGLNKTSLQSNFIGVMKPQVKQVVTIESSHSDKSSEEAMTV